MRILSIPKRLLKLQMTKSTSEVFAVKMQQFIARKNNRITGLVSELRDAHRQIRDLNKEIAEF